MFGHQFCIFTPEKLTGEGDEEDDAHTEGEAGAEGQGGDRSRGLRRQFKSIID
jgi:hypothetical protein